MNPQHDLQLADDVGTTQPGKTRPRVTEKLEVKREAHWWGQGAEKQKLPVKAEIFMKQSSSFNSTQK